ncbi:MAG: HDIG domain-containing protein [Actinobacteria bacterium]|nr:HDIG domain-containing protein [Actinomycetota bacterium]
MAPLAGSAWGQRALAAALAVIGIPAILSISAFWQEAPIREGEPSRRTVLAPDPIRVDDPETTERERRNVAESVEPILVPDNEARSAIVQNVEDTFARIEQAREPSSGDDGKSLSVDEQVAGLLDQLEDLPPSAIRQLVELDDDQLLVAKAQAVEVARDLALRSIPEGAVEQTIEQIDGMLAVHSFPDDVGQTAVKPMLAAALQPTVRIDEEATEAAREAAAAAVAPLQKSFPPGTPIVQVGETVSEVQMAALRARGLEGADPWLTVGRALALTAAIALSLAFYLRAYRPKVWGSARLLLLLSVLFVLYALTLQAAVVFASGSTNPLLYLLPAGAFAMLTTILFDPPVGVLVTIPITTLAAFMAPSRPGIIVFAALTCLASVPLVSRLSARGALRTAAWRSTLAYAVFAAVLAVVFGELGDVGFAALAGLASGILTAIIVNATLPFLESVFGVLTATSLLDLADRNHPLLRELERKALGSYNHSVEVSKMVERAARAVDADSLLASVAALYHDIGKVQRPYFFVENQFGIENPHENLEPEVSARIIKEHVTDGIEMARSYRMPAEIVEGIRTHHGTTLVSYFYRQAVNRAPEGASVDGKRFRYDGKKPASKETAILMLADCCEGATRAAALADRNLTREAIADIVTGLLDDRVEDGQLDEANITFRELQTVRESFIESLCYVYHPRITYPELRPRSTTVGRETTVASEASDATEAADAARANGHPRDTAKVRPPESVGELPH